MAGRDPQKFERAPAHVLDAPERERDEMPGHLRTRPGADVNVDAVHVPDDSAPPADGASMSPADVADGLGRGRLTVVDVREPAELGEAA